MGGGYCCGIDLKLVLNKMNTGGGYVQSQCVGALMSYEMQAKLRANNLPARFQTPACEKQTSGGLRDAAPKAPCPKGIIPDHRIAGRGTTNFDNL